MLVPYLPADFILWGWNCMGKYINTSLHILSWRVTLSPKANSPSTCFLINRPMHDVRNMPNLISDTVKIGMTWKLGLSPEICNFSSILEFNQMSGHCRFTFLLSLWIKLVFGTPSILKAVKFNPTFFVTLNPVSCINSSQLSIKLTVWIIVRFGFGNLYIPF